MTSSLVPLPKTGEHAISVQIQRYAAAVRSSLQFQIRFQCRMLTLGIRFQGKPVRICPRNHSAAVQDPAKIRTLPVPGRALR